MNKKREGALVRADVDERFAVRCQFPHQSEGRALGQHVLKFAKRIGCLLHHYLAAQIRTKSKFDNDDILRCAKEAAHQAGAAALKQRRTSAAQSPRAPATSELAMARP